MQYLPTAAGSKGLPGDVGNGIRKSGNTNIFVLVRVNRGLRIGAGVKAPVSPGQGRPCVRGNGESGCRGRNEPGSGQLLKGGSLVGSAVKSVTVGEAPGGERLQGGNVDQTLTKQVQLCSCLDIISNRNYMIDKVCCGWRLVEAVGNRTRGTRCADVFRRLAPDCPLGVRNCNLGSEGTRAS